MSGLFVSRLGAALTRLGWLYNHNGAPEGFKSNKKQTANNGVVFICCTESVCRGFWYPTANNGVVFTLQYIMSLRWLQVSDCEQWGCF
uniref:Uncharacterized protein n=1 Tax=Klebsiella pneumoniae TaxID=573 RepID=A0A8B0SW07_KLEPN|nr:hypothetical protein [Klebsiella pneumoniae]